MSPYQLTCLCGTIKEPIQCSKASGFPFPTSLCHCNPCRYASGALYSALPRLVAAPSKETLALCTHYASLGPTGLQRYFCTRCGTHICLLDVRDGDWHGGSGAIEPTTPTHTNDAAADRMRVTGHIFANDPGDGGIMGARPGLVRLRYGSAQAQAQAQARDLPCFPEWKEGPTTPYGPLRALSEASAQQPVPAETEQLTVKCHCGGTDLRIRRANYAQHLLQQQHEQQHEQQHAAVAADHIPPGDEEKSKYLAYFCACRSCRLANGLASLQPWAAVPPGNISVAATGEGVVFGSRSQEEEGGASNRGTTLKQFWSSERVCWSFCGRCGSLVFYWNEKRPEVVDVAVGNVRAEEGSMAQRWLWWRFNEVSHRDEVVDQEIYRAIVGE